MGLRKAKGDMYPFVDFTWNVFKGKCEYSCSYCYMKRFPQKPLRFDENEFKEFERDMKKYGEGQKIFVGSSCDMFTPSIDGKQIQKVLSWLGMFNCEYLFQTKNPARFNEVVFPEKSIFCVTIESDLDHKVSNALSPIERIRDVKNMLFKGHKIMITIEPIMEFSNNSFIHHLKVIEPFQINIGANTSNVKLPEPNKEEVLQLISECEKFTKVIQKKNLARLLK